MGSIFHGPYRQFEDLIPLHPDEGPTTLQELGGGRVTVAGARLVKQLPVAPIAVDMSRQESGLPLMRGENHGTGAVTEEAAGIPVAPVHHAAENLRPHNEGTDG